MKKYPFSVREHEEYGEIGIVMETGRRYFEPAFNGIIVAHDILEHALTPHSCAYTDELMAIGGYIAGRVKYDCSFSGFRGASINNVSTDIRSLLTSSLNEDGDDNPLFRVEKCNSYVQDTWTMDILRREVKEGITKGLKEWTDGKGVEERLDSYDINSIVGWICKGHQLFNKRFSGVYNYPDLFRSIAKESDIFLYDSFEGDSATLYVNFRSGEAFIDRD